MLVADACGNISVPSRIEHSIVWRREVASIAIASHSSRREQFPVLAGFGAYTQIEALHGGIKASIGVGS
jgi:hypothetical protein